MREFFTIFMKNILSVEATSLWDIEGKFSLKIISAGNLNVGKDASVRVFYYYYYYYYYY